MATLHCDSMSIVSEILAKRIKRRLKKDPSEKKYKKKGRERDESGREREREEALSAKYEDPYDEDYPWRVPPMTTAEILRAIKDGPSLNALMKKGNNDSNKGLARGSHIDQSDLDKLSPKTHNEKFYEIIPFKKFEDFMKSSYYEAFAKRCKRDVPLTREELGPSMIPLN